MPKRFNLTAIGIPEESRGVVILDIGLPDMEGTVVFAQIAELHPLLPVVFSTGHGDASKLEPFLSKPHVAFLLKPYEIDTLLDTLDRVVG